MLIDLGGVTRAQSKKDLENFPINKICQFTRSTVAPEIFKYSYAR